MSSERSVGSRSRSRSQSPRRAKIQSKRVIIANIPYDITWNKLKQLFRERVGFTGFLRLMKTNGRPNGMGVMEFKTVEGAEKAIELMNKFNVGDRSIVVREETLRDQERMSQMDFDGQAMGNDRNMNQNLMHRGHFGGVNMGPPQIINPAIAAMSTVTPMMLERMGITGPITDSLYISNLDYKVDWKKVKDIFKVIGRVIHASVKQDENGRSKGSAVVRFEHPYEALLALTMFNGEMINDRPIRVKIDREGSPAAPNMPIFPPTAAGTAAAANFINRLSSRRNQSGGRMMPAGFGGPNNMGPPSFMQGVMPQQSEAAAATMASFLNSLTAEGGPEGFPDMPMGKAPYGGQFRGAIPSNASMQSVELLKRILSQNCDLSASGLGPMLRNQGGDGGFGMSNFQSGANMNQLAQLMNGLKSGMRNMNTGFGMNSPEKRSVSRDEPNLSSSDLQQLFMAAAAGGMSQDQIANAASALGLDPESVAVSAFPDIGDTVSVDDQFGDRIANVHKQTMSDDDHPRSMNSRRMSRSDFAGQSTMNNQGLSFGAGLNQRQFSRQPQRGGPGGFRSVSRNMQMQQNSTSGRMYPKRPGNFGGN